MVPAARLGTSHKVVYKDRGFPLKVASPAGPHAAQHLVRQPIHRLDVRPEPLERRMVADDFDPLEVGASAPGGLSPFTAGSLWQRGTHPARPQFKS